jgi:hypothetical protein
MEAKSARDAQANWQNKDFEMNGSKHSQNSILIRYCHS